MFKSQFIMISIDVLGILTFNTLLEGSGLQKCLCDVENI